MLANAGTLKSSEDHGQGTIDKESRVLGRFD